MKSYRFKMKTPMFGMVFYMQFEARNKKAAWEYINHLYSHCKIKRVKAVKKKVNG